MRERDDPWDADSFAARCGAERVTAVSLVPTQVFDLVRARIPAPACLRAVLVGAGALRPVLFEAARALGWPVRASYGLTEAASTVAVQADGEPDSARLTVLPHWQAATGADGCLELRGPSLPVAVAAWDEATGRYDWRPLEPPLRTSDRVLLEGGTLVFLGRADRVVKRLGELIDLAQLERRLMMPRWPPVFSAESGCAAWPTVVPGAGWWSSASIPPTVRWWQRDSMTGSRPLRGSMTPWSSSTCAFLRLASRSPDPAGPGVRHFGAPGPERASCRGAASSV